LGRTLRIDELKHTLYILAGVPPPQQRLFYNSTELDNKEFLGSSTAGPPWPRQRCSIALQLVATHDVCVGVGSQMLWLRVCDFCTFGEIKAYVQQAVLPGVDPARLSLIHGGRRVKDSAAVGVWPPDVLALEPRTRRRWRRR
ncbi:hypothetical protein IWQ57_006268, partial [Coemansia nantahalensis]